MSWKLEVTTSTSFIVLSLFDKNLEFASVCGIMYTILHYPLIFTSFHKKTFLRNEHVLVFTIENLYQRKFAKYGAERLFEFSKIIVGEAKLDHD